MARPREFDEQEAITAALGVFWRRGYAATSTRELTAELGINPSSLYRTFGDKQQLYLRALDTYAQRGTVELHRSMAREGPVRDVLRRWLLDVVDALGGDRERKGCMMVNALTELGGHDPDATARAQAAFAGLKQALAATIRRGQREGDLSDTLQADTIASFLLNTLLGLRVQARGATDPNELASVVDVAMQVLD